MSVRKPLRNRGLALFLFVRQHAPERYLQVSGSYISQVSASNQHHGFFEELSGMGSYYRRFIKDFSLMVKPLTELTKKSNEFIWSDVCQEAFKKLKQAFIL
jgi:hypothetical protein